jgi:hypothetical protein
MMEELPEDVKEALRTVEEFRAEATPQEQIVLERARANVSNDIQATAAERQRDELANRVGKNYPALASALKGEVDISVDFPAFTDALNSVQEIENLESQKEEIELRIVQLKAQSEAILAGANAALEVRQRQSKEPKNIS